MSSHVAKISDVPNFKRNETGRIVRARFREILLSQQMSLSLQQRRFRICRDTEFLALHRIGKDDDGLCNGAGRTRACAKYQHAPVFVEDLGVDAGRYILARAQDKCWKLVACVPEGAGPERCNRPKLHMVSHVLARRDAFERHEGVV